ncbi:uncharacterized protein FIBRA_06663 [Fibroporia radiculosa]|uniref:NAD-dependent protein deacylase n=1 Tax=Fibroporia radiculosa TaxID=599839 RepID=J4GC58_9APHY|nr:uncharacterized protein FIBRA_06663 [Fibroporia radiculosa]CCM04483.1 predicted protein [Fibroporia radiculosa]
MSAFKDVLASSKHIIAVAGAGLSAASGIPTFRGAGGMWRKYDAFSIATPTAFRDNPSRVWQFYHYRRETARTAQPNDAHRALAEFSFQHIRDRVAPESTFTLITQNVDGLSRKALHSAAQNYDLPVPSDQPDPILLEMHGRLFEVICTANACGHREPNFNSPICPALAGTEELVKAGAEEPNIPLANLPRCTKCGALARPGVVWFEEVPYFMEEINTLVEQADLCLVVGTSSTVQPAASIASDVQDNGGMVAVFNIERTERDDEADFLFLGPCEKTLPAALGMSASERLSI